MKRVFVDTFAWVSIINKSDNYHKRCSTILKDLLTSYSRLYTSNFILVETINALSKVSYRQSLVEFINRIELSPNVEIIEITKDIYEHAWLLYKQRLDKEWGITDCTSFEVMTTFDINYAFTHDIHFTQAGFINLVE